MADSLAIMLLLAFVAALGAFSARAEIVAYVDDDGRRVFINTNDEELQAAARRGGASAALRLIERRKRSLPGIDQHIHTEARKHAVDPQLIHAVIRVESAWNPRARSRKGALGLMQLMPATGTRFGVRDLFDPRQNVSGGVRYLRFLLDRFDDNLELALAAYNAGENAVERAGGVPPYPETRRYLDRLAALYDDLDRGHAAAGGRIFAVQDENGRTVYVNE